jgi:hypothetical protein
MEWCVWVIKHSPQHQLKAMAPSLLERLLPATGGGGAAIGGGTGGGDAMVRIWAELFLRGAGMTWRGLVDWKDLRGSPWPERCQPTPIGHPRQANLDTAPLAPLPCPTDHSPPPCSKWMGRAAGPGAARRMRPCGAGPTKPSRRWRSGCLSILRCCRWARVLKCVWHRAASRFALSGRARLSVDASCSVPAPAQVRRCCCDGLLDSRTSAAITDARLHFSTCWHPNSNPHSPPPGLL